MFRVCVRSPGSEIVISLRFVFYWIKNQEKWAFNHTPSFLASLFFSPPLFLVEVRFPAAAELTAVGLRTATPRAFLIEEGTATVFSCFSSPEEMTPFVGESGESEVLIRFESCFGLPNISHPDLPLKVTVQTWQQKLTRRIPRWCLVYVLSSWFLAWNSLMLCRVCFPQAPSSGWHRRTRHHESSW